MGLWKSADKETWWRRPGFGSQAGLSTELLAATRAAARRNPKARATEVFLEFKASGNRGRWPARLVDQRQRGKRSGEREGVATSRLLYISGPH